MPDSPFIGPTYFLRSKPASTQRTINLMPVPLEPGNERAGWVFEDVPGLVAVEVAPAPPPPPGPSFKDDLIAWWDSTVLIADTAIEDQHIHHLHMEVPALSDTTSVAGVNGNALKMLAYSTGGHSIGTKQTSPLLYLGDVSFAFGRWVRIETPLPPNNTYGRLLMGRWHGGQDGSRTDLSYALFYSRTAGSAQFYMTANGSAPIHGPTPITGIADGNWHFVVASYDALTNVMSLWVDAGTPNTATHVGGAYAAADAYFSFDYRFGVGLTGGVNGDNDAGSFNYVTVDSSIMSAFVLGRAITQAEVVMLYDSGSRLLYADLP